MEPFSYACLVLFVDAQSAICLWLNGLAAQKTFDDPMCATQTKNCRRTPDLSVLRTSDNWYGSYATATLIPAWISNYIHDEVWDEITYPFPNLSGATVAPLKFENG